MLCLLQDGSRGHTLHQCQTWQWEPPARQLWPCKQKLRVWAKTSPSFPIVRSSVPATPGAPPEVFVEARMELWAAIRGLFYIRIESTGKTILTDLVVGNSAICRLFVQMSVYPTTLAAWSKHVRHSDSNSKCWTQNFFFFPVNQHVNSVCIHWNIWSWFSFPTSNNSPQVLQTSSQHTESRSLHHRIYYI